MPDSCFAAVDMGTNSFHLIIVKIKKDDKFKIVGREREMIRLGSETGENLNHISEHETEKAIKILKKFKKLAGSYKTSLKAIATSAVREADNKNDFVKKIFLETGIKIEVIEGSKEAGLIYMGAQKALKLSDKKVLCVDIGGGSTELVLGNNSKTVFAESVKIGAVRLSKLFFPDYILSRERIDKCNNYIISEIKKNKKIFFENSLDIAAGSSGTIQATAKLISALTKKKELKKLNDFAFSADELKEISEKVLSCYSPEERLRIKGMEDKRADILPAGLLVLNNVFDLFKIEKMTVSEYALREGIILEHINKM